MPKQCWRSCLSLPVHEISYNYDKKWFKSESVTSKERLNLHHFKYPYANRVGLAAVSGVGYRTTTWSGTENAVNAHKAGPIRFGNRIDVVHVLPDDTAKQLYNRFLERPEIVRPHFVSLIKILQTSGKLPEIEYPLPDYDKWLDLAPDPNLTRIMYVDFSSGSVVSAVKEAKNAH